MVLFKKFKALGFKISEWSLLQLIMKILSEEQIALDTSLLHFYILTATET